MSYEPFLIAPWDSPNNGLVEYYKPWLIGNDAFPVIEDAYSWRGAVRKREGFILLGTLPTVPVQGLRIYLVPATGDQQLIAFSTTKAYIFNTTTSVFNDISFFQTSSAAISWTGGNDNFFWSSNYQNSMWATNFIDPLRFYNGSPTAGWNNQRPTLNGSNVLQQCLIVLPYKGRLVILNTVEGTIDGSGNPTASTSYRNRARWSQIGTSYVPTSGGDPVVVPPTGFATDANAWRDDIPGRGGFVDADTSERIISAGIVRDTLIVFFQRSTWRLRYTNNEVLPFQWERINTQYGSEATFSTISFDEHLLTFSRFGFIAADTNTVVRIDEKIPDQSFMIKAGSTLNNLNRIHGIRDFYRQTAYWTYPSESLASTVPDKILTYNYLEKSWARFNQDFRVYGYFSTFNDLIWSAATSPWEDMDDTAWSSPWNSNQFPQVVSGDSSLASGNVYIVYDVPFQSQDNGSNFNFAINTKFFNPYIKEGHRCKLGFIDIYCTGTEDGQITVNHFIDDDTENIIYTQTVNISKDSNARYVRVYFGTIARNHLIQFTLTNAQIDDPQQGTAQFEMQGLLIWTRRAGRLKTQ